MDYPQWLIRVVEDAMSTNDPTWVLDALGFHPDLREFIKKGRVHADCEVWEATVDSPELHARRRAALDEIVRLGQEIEDDNDD